MFDKLKQVGELAKLRGQAKALQKQLKKEEIEVEERGIRVVITADQEIRKIVVEGEESPALVEVINKAIRKSQKVAAKKLQVLAGEMFGLGR